MYEDDSYGYTKESTFYNSDKTTINIITFIIFIILSFQGPNIILKLFSNLIYFSLYYYYIAKNHFNI